jgi:hypothetical protein
MKVRICGLALILIGFLSSVGSAETPIERGSYLVNTVVPAVTVMHGIPRSRTGRS